MILLKKLKKLENRLFDRCHSYSGTGKISTRKLKHERADEGVRVRVSKGEGEGEVKRVLFSSKVTSARSC